MKLLRAVRLLIIVTIMSFLSLMLTGIVSGSALAQFAGVGVPLTLMLSGLTSHYEDRQKAEQLRLKQARRYGDTDRRDFERKLNLLENQLAYQEAQLREAELLPEEREYLRKYPVGPGTPAEQLRRISQQYGLPVTTRVGKAKRALPLLREHVCDGKFYANYTFCPEHRDVSPDTSVSSKANWNAASRPAAKTEPEYSPDGYGEMLAALLGNMYAWVQDAQEHGGEYEWHMSDAWAKDVAAIPEQLDPVKNRNVVAQFQPGAIFGYHVVTGAQFGAPELVAA